MKAVINLDVPDYQIGQPVTVYFKDTMMKHGTCEPDQVVRCKDCKHSEFNEDSGFYECQHPFGLCGMAHRANWFCADGEKR